MAVRRFKISLHVLKNISQGSTDFLETTVYLDKGKIYYVAISNNDLFTYEYNTCYFRHENQFSHKSSPGISLMFIKLIIVIILNELE